MKKSLLALAVLGAFAGTAAAQTNITLYGIADAGVGMFDNDGTAPNGRSYDSTVGVFSGVQSTSRFGIRGSEDLGNGLKATFNLEAEVNFDTGATGGDTYTAGGATGPQGSGFFQRRAVVGLAGGFGEVRLGRDYTPGFTAAGTTDVMGYGLFGNWLTYTAQAGGLGVTTRASNGIHYTSPNWGGFTVRAMYATGEADDATLPSNSGDLYGLSGVYANGPLTVSGYYQRAEVANLGTTVAPAFGTYDIDQYGIGAQYRFGAFRVAFNYGMADSDQGIEHEGWGLGAGMKLGVGEVLVNYIHQEADVDGPGADPEADTWGIAYVHPVSKRTNFYASYGQTDNDNANSSFGLRYSQSFVGAGAGGAKPKAFAVGVRHLF